MRKTMKGGGWFWPDVTTSSDTTEPTKTYLERIFDFFNFSKTAEPASTTPTLDTTTPTSNTGGYMGGKRKGKTAKKPCPKKGGGK